MNKNDIINMAYHGVVLASLVFGYSAVAKKVFSVKTVNLDKTKPMDVAKLGGIVMLASTTQAMLIKQGILKPDISPWK